MAEITHSPKEQFQANKERRLRWAEIVRDPVCQSAITHAQAHLAHSGFHSPDAMRGVVYFIKDLLNLAEPEEQPKIIPVQHLESYGIPTPETQDQPNE